MTSEKTKKKNYFKKLLQRRVKVNVISLRGVFLRDFFLWEMVSFGRLRTVGKIFKYQNPLNFLANWNVFSF